MGDKRGWSADRHTERTELPKETLSHTTKTALSVFEEINLTTLYVVQLQQISHTSSAGGDDKSCR